MKNILLSTALALTVGVSAQAGTNIVSTYDDDTGLLIEQTWTDVGTDTVIQVVRTDTSKAKLFAHNSSRYMSNGSYMKPMSITMMSEGVEDTTIPVDLFLELTVGLGGTIEAGIKMKDAEIMADQNPNDPDEWSWKINMEKQDGGERLSHADAKILQGLVDQYFDTK